MANIFISYAREDKEIASRIEKALERARHEGWLEKHKLLGGHDYRVEIDKGLRKCSAVLVVMSPAARKSEYVTYEWAFALGAGVPVIPILVKATKVHRRLEPLQYVDLSSKKKNWRYLIEAVIRNGNGRARNTVVKAGSPRPFMFATFEMDGDSPKRVGRSYKIWIGTKNVPKETERVKYEILDETFEDNKFSSEWGQGEYEDWITSWGDVFMTAKGKYSAGEWRVKTRLSEALRRGYGKRMTTPIRRALVDIEKH